MNEPIAFALMKTLISPNEADRNMESANVVNGLFAIARALNHVGDAIERLGINGADTNMGAIELLSKEVRDGFRSLAIEIGAIEA